MNEIRSNFLAHLFNRIFSQISRSKLARGETLTIVASCYSHVVIDISATDNFSLMLCLLFHFQKFDGSHDKQYN